MNALATSDHPLTDEDALRLADAPREAIRELMEAACSVRDRHWGRRITFSPKVFLPITNLCRNYCGYCSFRRSPDQPGEWTMTPDEVTSWLDRARAAGCAEALLCLGDKPESVFPTYQATLRTFGHETTVDYLCAVSELALARGLLPHTNAGILSANEMARLKEVNVSLGLMLESASDRLCEAGMPHQRAPDKRPAVRLRMIEEAGELAIPFTTGILIGIGETARERIESLLAIRRLHRKHGHIQEVIVQSFRAREKTAMRSHTELDDLEIAHAIAMARLIFDHDVSVQAPPNLNPAKGDAPEPSDMLFASGINDLGGISPVTPDYINPRHPWPHLERLAETCARDGYALAPRLAIYDAYIERDGFLHPALAQATREAAARIRRVRHPSELATSSPANEERRAS